MCENKTPIHVTNNSNIPIIIWCRYKEVQYNISFHITLRQAINQYMYSQRTPHTSPSRPSFGVSLVMILFRENMMTSSNGNVFHVAGPLWGESTGHRCIPIKRASDAELFSLICAWTNGRANHRDAGDLRRHGAHYDVTIMVPLCIFSEQGILECSAGFGFMTGPSLGGVLFQVKHSFSIHWRCGNNF